jgi:hypothetical protein
METGLLEIQAEHLRCHLQNRQLLPDSREAIHAAFRPGDCESTQAISRNAAKTVDGSVMKANASTVDPARCFLRLANLPNFVLDRLGCYEAPLSRQACRILHALEILDRRKPQERTRPVSHPLR